MELWKKSQRQFDVVQKKATSQGNRGPVHRNIGFVEMLLRIQKLYNTKHVAASQWIQYSCELDPNLFHIIKHRIQESLLLGPLEDERALVINKSMFYGLPGALILSLSLSSACAFARSTRTIGQMQRRNASS